MTKNLRLALRRNQVEKNFKIIGVSSKHPSSPDLISLDYGISGRFRKQNKCNFSSKYWTAIEEEFDRMLEEFILKVCKSFRRRVNTMIKKWWPY